MTLGHPPAQRKSDIPADSSQEPNTPVVLRGTRASTMLSVYSVQWLGSDTIKIAVSAIDRLAAGVNSAFKSFSNS